MKRVSVRKHVGKVWYLRQELYAEGELQVKGITGQILAKANHYQAVQGQYGAKRIIKDDKIRAYEKSFVYQCKEYRNKGISVRFRLFVRVYHRSRFDLDNSLKTLLDCLQMVGAIKDDKLCFEIQATKYLDKQNPRVEFAIQEINEQKNIFSNNSLTIKEMQVIGENEKYVIYLAYFKGMPVRFQQDKRTGEVLINADDAVKILGLGNSFEKYLGTNDGLDFISEWKKEHPDAPFWGSAVRKD